MATPLLIKRKWVIGVTKTGWWTATLEITIEGEPARFDDLDECSQEHIANCIKEGYVSGEIIMEEDE